MNARKTLSRPAVRVALGVAFVLSIPLVAMLFSDEVVWSLADFVLAGALLTTLGIVLELAARKAGNRATAVGIGTAGVAAALLGEADDAPGLVLLGILLVAGACALGVRSAQHIRWRRQLISATCSAAHAASSRSAASEREPGSAV